MLLSELQIYCKTFVDMYDIYEAVTMGEGRVIFYSRFRYPTVRDY
jgi:hypothetical protein